MALNLAVRVGVPLLAKGICWTSVIGMSQQVCGLLGPLVVSTHAAPQKIRDSLEELDLMLHISVITDLIQSSLPPIHDDNSWILPEMQRSAEQRVAQKIYETLDEMRSLLKIVNDRIAAYDKSWVSIWSLNLDTEIAQLERKKRVFDMRCKLLWQVLQIKDTDKAGTALIIKTV